MSPLTMRYRPFSGRFFNKKFISYAMALDIHSTSTDGWQVHETQALVDVLNSVDEVVVDSEDNPIAWPLAMAGQRLPRRMG